MQDPANELRRILLPRTPVNKGKTKHSLALEEPLVGNKEERRTGILEGGGSSGVLYSAVPLSPHGGRLNTVTTSENTHSTRLGE